MSLGSNLVQIWFRFGSDLVSDLVHGSDVVQIWFRFGSDLVHGSELVQTCFKFGSGSFQPWYRFGSDLVPIWFRCGSDVLQMWFRAKPEANQALPAGPRLLLSEIKPLLTRLRGIRLDYDQRQPGNA